MIALIMLAISIFGLVCRYFGYKQGLKDGMGMTKKAFNDLLDRILDEQIEKSQDKVIKKMKEEFEDGKSSEIRS